MESEDSVKITYDREELLLLGEEIVRSKVVSSKVTYRVSRQTWNSIKSLGLETAKSIKRGKRGGKRKLDFLTSNAPDISKNNIQIKRTESNKNNSKYDLKVSYMNARSVVNKSESIAEYLIEDNIDVCAITETWLKSGSDDKIAVGNLTPTGYEIAHVAYHEPGKEEEALL